MPSTVLGAGDIEIIKLIKIHLCSLGLGQEIDKVSLDLLQYSFPQYNHENYIRKYPVEEHSTIFQISTLQNC